MRRGIDMILAGMAVVILDFRVQGVDVLPDPVGHVLAAAGVLAAARAGFPRAWAWGAAAGFAVAAALSIPEALFHEPPPPGLHFEPFDAMGLVRSLAGTAMDLAFLATMAGLSLVAARLGAEPLARHARLAARAFGVLVALGVLLDLAWLVAGPEDVWPFALALLVPQLVAFVAALVLLWRGRALAPPPVGPPSATPQAF